MFLKPLAKGCVHARFQPSLVKVKRSRTSVEGDGDGFFDRVGTEDDIAGNYFLQRGFLVFRELCKGNHLCEELFGVRSTRRSA